MCKRVKLGQIIASHTSPNIGVVGRLEIRLNIESLKNTILFYQKMNCNSKIKPK